MSTANSSNHPPLRIPPAVPYAVLALAVFATYRNVFGNQFVFDDDILIVSNAWLRGWGHVRDILSGSTINGANLQGGFYRPLQILLYLLVFNLGKGLPLAFHALNVLLHAANTCLVYKLGRKMLFDARASFVAALLWGVHPLHTEAVTYISGTADPLMAFFCLSGCIVLLPDFSQSKVKAVLPLLVLGILSKETMIIFPALAALCLLYAHPKPFSALSHLPTWPLWIAAGLYALWRINAPGLDGPVAYSAFYKQFGPPAMKLYAEQPVVRFFTFLATLPEYLKLIVLPENLHMERVFPVETSIRSTNVLMGLTAAAFAACTVVYGWVERHFEALGWGFLWFGIAYAPNSGLFAPLNQLFLEHWMYLPTAGLFLGIAQTAVEAAGKHRAVVGTIGFAAGNLALLLYAKTFDQNVLWHDPVSLYSTVFEAKEPSPRAHGSLGLYYSDRGQYEKAIKAFKDAIAIGDVYPEPRYNLAITYLRQSQDKKSIGLAIENLKRATEIQGDFGPAHEMLAEIYRHRGQKEEEFFHKERAEEIRRRAE